MNTPHYGLAYPPKPFRWRRWFAVLALLLAAYWQFGRYTFEIVEIDDGSAPAVGQYLRGRVVNGSEIDATAYVELGNANSRAIILHAPYRTWSRTIRIEFGEDASSKASGVNSVEITRQFGILNRHCVVVVRWIDKSPTTSACARIPGEGWRKHPS